MQKESTEVILCTKLTNLIRVLALRISRKCYLEHMVDTESPVLMIEKELVEMAYSQLSEQLFIALYDHRLSSIQPVIAKVVTNMAVMWLNNLEVDKEDKEKMKNGIYMEVKRIFPSVH